MTYSILIVDDEANNFDVIEGLLASKTYELDYASCGQDAIDSLEQFDPDLILLDVMMPGIDGIEVCKRIKAMPQWQSIPIIMVTALDSREDLARCLLAGADDFVSKPINSIELRARVQSMLRIKKQYDRIQSLSKLQRNSIHYLENSLHDLHLDLAVSFPNELNAPLNNILDNIFLLQQSFVKDGNHENDRMLESVNRSTIELDKLNQSFLFYLQLALPIKDATVEKICNSKQPIEQIVLRQIAKFYPATKLVLKIEDTKLAVTPKHLQYMVGELLDYVLKSSSSQAFINIYGQTIDDAFHVYIDNREARSTNNPTDKLSELIQCNSGLESAPELGIGLKIVKKIIEIYDGLFLMDNVDPDRTTIYITLPLSPSVRSVQASNKSINR